MYSGHEIKAEHTYDANLGKLETNLTEISVELSTATHTTTAAGVGTIPSAKVWARLGSSRAVDQLILVQASTGAACAGEDTGVHVRCTFRTNNRHGVSVHVDFSGNVNDAVGRSESSLAPGVRDLPIDEGTTAVDWSPGTRPAIGERDSFTAVLSDGDSDLWSNSIDPRSGDSPNNKHEILASGVVVRVSEYTIRANPRCAS